MYKLQLNDWRVETKYVIRLEDNAYIPFDPANTDFVEYQKWLSEGGVPLPADE
jgi:hypothetical protein